MDFVKVDCCPVPTADHMDKIIQELLDESGARAESLYRGSDPRAAKFLTGGPPCYKHDQAWIYAHYPPGVANPPGISTHELFNDGAAYPVPVGARLEAWQLGIDIDDPHVVAFMEAGRKRGYVITQTYPGSSVEYHHVNFRFKPKYVPPFDPMELHERGDRIIHLTKRLHFIRAPHSGPYLVRPRGKLWVPYGTFKVEVEEAVEEFQRDHHLKPDGVVGIHTFEQIERTFRHQYQRRKRRHVPQRHRIAVEDGHRVAKRRRG